MAYFSLPAGEAETSVCLSAAHPACLPAVGVSRAGGAGLLFQWHTQARQRRRTHLLKIVASEIDSDGGENQRGPPLPELILQTQPVVTNTANFSVRGRQHQQPV